MKWKDEAWELLYHLIDKSKEIDEFIERLQKAIAFESEETYNRIKAAIKDD